MTSINIVPTSKLEKKKKENIKPGRRSNKQSRLLEPKRAVCRYLDSRMACEAEDQNSRFFIAVHVGAGYHAPSSEKALRSAMKRACLAAASILCKVFFFHLFLTGSFFQFLCECQSLFMCIRVLILCVLVFCLHLGFW